MTNSVIDPSAKIDHSVKIGPFCFIGPNVEIGPDCVLHSHVVIKGPTKIDAGNIFYQFSTIGEDTPDKKYNGEATTLEIGAIRKSSNDPICLLFTIDTEGLSKLS